jgi:hypothetical protein
MKLNFKMKAIIPEDKIETVLNIHYSRRTLFDSGTYQFNKTEYDDKVQTLSRMVYFGVSLHKYIREYKKYYSSPTYLPLRNNVGKTLIGIISHIRTGICYNYWVTKPLEDASDREIISALVKEIKEKILPQYDFKKYITGFAEYKSGGKGEDYFRQKAFFKFNFENEPVYLSIRDAEEDLPYHCSYKHLFNFLDWQMFEYLHNNNMEQLYPQMGMARNLENLIKRHFPKEKAKLLYKNERKRKKALLDFVQELIEIVYLYKTM